MSDTVYLYYDGSWDICHTGEDDYEFPVFLGYLDKEEGENFKNRTGSN